MAKKAKKHPKRRQRPTRATGRAPVERVASPLQFRTTDGEWREMLVQHFRRRRRQKVVGWCLLGLAALVALNHLLEHTDAIDLLRPVLSPGWQDLVAGFPIAIVLAFTAAILLGQADEPPARERA